MLTFGSKYITISGKDLEDVESFVYLGSIVDNEGGTDRDIMARIGKGNSHTLGDIRCSNVWMVNSNVESLLLYGSDTWRATKKMNRKLQTGSGTI